MHIQFVKSLASMVIHGNVIANVRRRLPVVVVKLRMDQLYKHHFIMTNFVGCCS